MVLISSIDGPNLNPTSWMPFVARLSTTVIRGLNGVEGRVSPKSEVMITSLQDDNKKLVVTTTANNCNLLTALRFTVVPHMAHNA
jgi:hypothetical protein